MTRRIYWFYLLVLVAAVALEGSAAGAVSFTGDLEMSTGGDTISGKIFVTADFYRMDIKQHGDEFSVIVDRQAGVTRVLLPMRKQYIEIKSNEPVSRMSDPFQGLTFLAASAQERNIGTDTIDDYECQKRVLSMQGQDVMTYWYATRLDFPIKIENIVSPGTFAYIDYISEGPVESSVFSVPPGYTSMAAPGDEPPDVPEWASRIGKAPTVTPPVEKAMAAGDMIRIKVQPGRSVWVRAVASSDDAVVKAIPFRDGLPVKDISMYSNFAQRGVICDRRNETAAEADEVVVRVFDGTATVQVKCPDMQEKLVAAGETFSYAVTSDENIELRLVDVSEGPSECTWTWLTGGVPVSEERMGPLKYRTVAFDHDQTVSRKTLSPIGDTLAITVSKGEIIVKLGQYDSFEW